MNEKIPQPLVWEDWGDCAPANPSQRRQEKTAEKAGGRKPRMKMEGMRFGRIVVIGSAPDRPKPNSHLGMTMWHCLCDCGKEKVIPGISLRQGQIVSCGCYAREVCIKRSTVHGYATRNKRGRTYRIWMAMKTRCSNSKIECAYRYSERGISVCDEWKDSYESFLKDMGECPPKHSIERKDNDLGYSKSNCIWADQITQMNNTSRNVFIEHDGNRMTVTQWARHTGINAEVLYHRIKTGMPVSEMLTTPVRKCVRNSL